MSIKTCTTCEFKKDCSKSGHIENYTITATKKCTDADRLTQEKEKQILIPALKKDFDDFCKQTFGACFNNEILESFAEKFYSRGWRLDELLKNKTCKTCQSFIGGGDWDLCCSNPPESRRTWCGFLCYEDDPACENYKENSK